MSITIPTNKENEDALELSTEERKSVREMLPPYVREAVDSVPEELKLMDEKQLRKHVKPNPSVQALRNSFWIEYARCLDKGVEWMRISNIISGICSIEYWTHVVMKSSGLVEWVLRPPISYNKAMEEALYFGVEKLREIMDLPFVTTRVDPKTGFEVQIIDTKVADLVLKAFMIADTRVKGSVVQRSETKTLNVQAKMSDVKGAMESQSMEDIERKLKDLRKRDQLLESTVIEIDGEKASS